MLCHMDEGHRTPRDPAEDAFEAARIERQAKEAAEKRAAELRAIQAEYEQASADSKLDQLRERIFETTMDAVNVLDELMHHATSTAVRRDAAKALLSHGVAMAKISDTNDSIEEILRRAASNPATHPMEDLDTP